MKNICFVVVYFGLLPHNFQLWLNACKYNEKINWILFTDDKAFYAYPANVSVTYTTMSEIKERIQSIYDFTISLDSPYKLCDYKVAYGDIFQEELKGFRFWGYCDLDLIFGNISNFITDDILDGYDKILSRGHCTLFRNTIHNNQMYQTKINGKEKYREVFSNKGSFCFDEWALEGINTIYVHKGISIYDEIIFSDIYTGTEGFYPVQLLNNGTKNNSLYLWDRGTLFQIYEKKGNLIQEEVLYVHLQKRAMHVEPQANDAKRLLIFPNTYMACSFDVTIDVLRQYRKDTPFPLNYYKMRCTHAIKKITCPDFH